MSVADPEKRRLLPRRHPLLGRVLAVDDDLATLAQVHDSLDCWHYAVETMQSPLDTLRRIESQAFDVVIAALRMREMSGEEFIGHLRRHLRYRRVPILVLFEETDRVRFDALRVEMSISKPFRPSTLLRAVDTLMAVRRRHPLAAVVRRDWPEALSALDDRRAELLNREILWDRRLHQRRGDGPRRERERSGSDRRIGDRRVTPPESWDLLGYVLVSARGDEPATLRPV